jgi:hypothetical protein
MVDFLRVSFIDDPRPVVQCFDCKTAISSDDAMRLLLVAGESGLAAKLGDRCLSRLMAGNEDFQYCPSCSAPISGCSTTQFWDCCCGFTFCVTCRKSEAKHGKNAKCSEPFNLRKTEAERNEQLFNKWQEEEAQNVSLFAEIRSCFRFSHHFSSRIRCARAPSAAWASPRTRGATT